MGTVLPQRWGSAVVVQGTGTLGSAEPKVRVNPLRNDSNTCYNVGEGCRGGKRGCNLKRMQMTERATVSTALESDAS